MRKISVKDVSLRGYASCGGANVMEESWGWVWTKTKSYNSVIGRKNIVEVLFADTLYLSQPSISYKASRDPTQIIIPQQLPLL